MAKLRVKARQGQGRCPYCMDDLEGEVFACVCGAEYHQACTKELRSCAVLGCERALSGQESARRERAPAAERAAPFLREGTGPVVVQRGGFNLTRAAKVAAFVLAVVFLNWLGMRKGPLREDPYVVPRPRVTRERTPSQELIVQRDQVMHGLRALVRLRMEIDALRGEGQAQMAGELELIYQTKASELLADCDYGGPLAGGPQAFQAHMRREVPKDPSLAPQAAQQVLQDFFSAPCW